MKTTGDAEIFIASSAALRSSLQQTKAMLKKVGELPQVKVRRFGIGELPRAYVAVASYLKRLGTSLTRKTFEKYFLAIQEMAPFEMNELWQLQSFAKMAVLEGVAEQAAGIDVAKSIKAVEPRMRTKIADWRRKAKPADARTPVTMMTKLIGSLRRVDGTDWKEMFERVNAIEQVLRRDPCDAYASMDFESRDHYRKLISRAGGALKSHRAAGGAKRSSNWRGRFRRRPMHECDCGRSHVGYYLVG